MKKILMVDDDALVCRLFNRKFEFEGYLVEVCTDGLSAIEAVQNNAYDLVLLDLMLPKANGVEVLVALRDRGTRRDTPVVVFSNSQSSALVQAAWQAGADRCRTKTNCTPRQLVDKVGFCLITVADAAAALALLAENRFDLVLSDVNMPGTNGFDFCAQLRKLPNGRAVPVIFITSLSDFETRTRYALAGGSDFVAKPFSLTELSLRALCCVFKSRLTLVPVSQVAAPAVQITQWNTESYAPAIHALA